jgi:hypothetical protein
MRWLLSLALLLPLLVGGTPRCPPPQRPSLADCPFQVDPNLVQGALLDYLRIRAGEKFAHTRTWCDEEGDPAEARLVSAPEGVELINRPKINSYTLLWTPTEPMTCAIVIEVTDRPLDRQPRSSTGTILVQVVPRRQRMAPAGCGGRPRS